MDIKSTIAHIASNERKLATATRMLTDRRICDAEARAWAQVQERAEEELASATASLDDLLAKVE